MIQTRYTMHFDRQFLIILDNDTGHERGFTDVRDVAAYVKELKISAIVLTDVCTSKELNAIQAAERELLERSNSEPGDDDAEFWRAVERYVGKLAKSPHVQGYSFEPAGPDYIRVYCRDFSGEKRAHSFIVRSAGDVFERGSVLHPKSWDRPDRGRSVWSIYFPQPDLPGALDPDAGRKV